jgi:hypothetical protein
MRKNAAAGHAPARNVTVAVAQKNVRAGQIANATVVAKPNLKKGCQGFGPAPVGSQV